MYACAFARRRVADARRRVRLVSSASVDYYFVLTNRVTFKWSRARAWPLFYPFTEQTRSHITLLIKTTRACRVRTRHIDGFYFWITMHGRCRKKKPPVLSTIRPPRPTAVKIPPVTGHVRSPWKCICTKSILGTCAYLASRTRYMSSRNVLNVEIVEK